MKKYLDNLRQYQFLLSELVKKGIKLKYRRSYLGILWSMLEPLLSMVVLTIVFGTLYGNTDKTFPVYILSGRLLYFSFTGSAVFMIATFNALDSDSIEIIAKNAMHKVI